MSQLIHLTGTLRVPLFDGQKWVVHEYPNTRMEVKVNAFAALASSRDGLLPAEAIGIMHEQVWSGNLKNLEVTRTQPLQSNDNL